MLTLNVITDPRRPERRLICESHLTEMGIPYRIWNAVYDLPTVISSISKSHKTLVEVAKAVGAWQIAIAEDDVWFPSKDGWKYFLNSMPDRFDMYMAGVYGTELPPVQPLRTFVGLHCYIIRFPWYERFLATPDDQHIDTAQAGGIFHCAYPFAALQRAGYSANNQKDCDYNTGIIRPQDIFSTFK